MDYTRPCHLSCTIDLIAVCDTCSKSAQESTYENTNHPEKLSQQLVREGWPNTVLDYLKHYINLWCLRTWRGLRYCPTNSTLGSHETDQCNELNEFESVLPTAAVLYIMALSMHELHPELLSSMLGILRWQDFAAHLVCRGLVFAHQADPSAIIENPMVLCIKWCATWCTFLQKYSFAKLTWYTWSDP